MKQVVLIFGAIYGGLAVVFGAFGAHALKALLTIDKLKSFETGVKYQMYHALVLLFIGLFFDFSTRIQQYMAWSFIIGAFLFSVSIYLLALSSVWSVNLRFLGPVTPFGGMLLVIGWCMLLVSIVKLKLGS